MTGLNYRSKALIFLLIFLPKVHKLILFMKKYLYEQKLEDILQNNWSMIFQRVSSIKSCKDWELLQTERDQRDMTAKSNVRF